MLRINFIKLIYTCIELKKSKSKVFQCSSTEIVFWVKVSLINISLLFNNNTNNTRLVIAALMVSYSGKHLYNYYEQTTVSLLIPVTSSFSGLLLMRFNST